MVEISPCIPQPRLNPPYGLWHRGLRTSSTAGLGLRNLSSYTLTPDLLAKHPSTLDHADLHPSQSQTVHAKRGIRLTRHRISRCWIIHHSAQGLFIYLEAAKISKDQKGTVHREETIRGFCKLPGPRLS